LFVQLDYTSISFRKLYSYKIDHKYLFYNEEEEKIKLLAVDYIPNPNSPNQMKVCLFEMMNKKN
jgi:hypothetical protein